MSAFFFDTTVFIDYVKSPPEPAAVEYANEVLQGQSTGRYSPVTVAELWTGTMAREQEIKLAALMVLCELAPLDSTAARRAGMLLRGRDAQQVKAHFADALIAATARPEEEEIVTADKKSSGVFPNVRYRTYELTFAR